MTNDYGNLELHKVLLSAMKDIDRICRENGLRYYLYAGTLLGAVNHQGFIPWDDDVDIVMFAGDFYKLAEILENEYANLYTLMTFENSPDWYSKMCKIQVNGAYIINSKNKTPVFIDVSILHSVPDAKLLRCIQKKQIEFLNLSLGVLSGEIVPSSWITKLTIARYARRGKERLGCELDKVMRRYDHICTRDVGIMCNTLTCNPYTGVSGYDTDITRREWHETPVDVVFEDMSAMTYSHIEEYLDWQYGKKWRDPYPEEKRITKHDVKSYEISPEVRARIGL